MSSSESIKEAHEAFVSGHSGSSPQDIILATYPAIPASIAAAVIGKRCSGWFGYLMECVLLLFPITLSFTYLANYAFELSALMTMIAGLSLFFVPYNSKFNNEVSKSGNSNQKCIRYLTVVRAHLNIVTAVAILAVDFRSFPRRFVKAEEYGYSLMDGGAAGFVICNGVVEGRKKPSFRSVMKNGAILSVLGVLRFLSVRATNYQHHITEYGVHANFFFTLAFIKMTCSWWIWKLGPIQSVLISLIISISHQGYLVLGGGAAWVLSNAPRDTLIAANREWIIAMPGYVSIYFMGAAIGSYIFNARSLKIKTSKSWSLILLTLASLGVLIVLHNYVELPSRRVANPTFIQFCVFFKLVVLAHYALIEDVFDRFFPSFSFVPVVSEAINKQSLLCFLLANLGTGLINKSINTLDVSYPYDLLIINCYIIGLVGVLVNLHVRKSKVTVS